MDKKSPNKFGKTTVPLEWPNRYKFDSAVRGVACIFRGVRTVENVRGASKARADDGSGDMPPPPNPDQEIFTF